MSSGTWNLVGLVLTGVGALVGLIGTLMIANGYYPGTIGSFLISLPGMLFDAILFRRKPFEIAQRFGREDRTLTLMGVLVIFVGFLLQLVGAICAFTGTLPDVPLTK